MADVVKPFMTKTIQQFTFLNVFYCMFHTDLKPVASLTWMFHFLFFKEINGERKEKRFQKLMLSDYL